jgi:hypothetical protein
MSRRETLAAGLATTFLLPTAAANAYDSLDEAARKADVARRYAAAKEADAARRARLKAAEAAQAEAAAAKKAEAAAAPKAKRTSEVPKPSKDVAVAQQRTPAKPTVSKPSTAKAVERGLAGTKSAGEPRRDSKPTPRRPAPAPKAEGRARKPTAPTSRSTKPTPKKPKIVKETIVKPKKKKQRGSNILRDTLAIALFATGVLLSSDEKAGKEAKEVAKDPEHEEKDRFKFSSVFSRMGGRKTEREVDSASVAVVSMSEAKPPEPVSEIDTVDLDESEDASKTKQIRQLEELVNEMELALTKIKEKEADAEGGTESSGRGPGRKTRIGSVLVLGAVLRFLWTHRLVITILP